MKFKQTNHSVSLLTLGWGITVVGLGGLFYAALVEVPLYPVVWAGFVMALGFFCVAFGINIRNNEQIVAIANNDCSTHTHEKVLQARAALMVAGVKPID